MRLLAVILALFQGLNGLVMLAVPERWYLSVPGVTLTGPFNEHFVRDTGLGFLAAAVALLAFAGTRQRALVLPALAFVGGHALMHLGEIITVGVLDAAALRDLALIVAPGLLPALLLFHRPGSMVAPRPAGAR